MKRGESQRKYSIVRGQRLWALTVIREVESIKEMRDRVFTHRCAEFQCDCGKVFQRTFHPVRKGNNHDCGCGIWNRNRGHHMKGTRTYSKWSSMMGRAISSRKERLCRDYSERGIRVDPRWFSFETFFADMGHAPEGMTLERIDNDRGYSKENCRWASMKEQARNKRSNVWVTYKGEKVLFVDLVEKLNLNYFAVWQRLRKGWPVEKAIEQPVTTKFYRKDKRQ